MTKSFIRMKLNTNYQFDLTYSKIFGSKDLCIRFDEYKREMERGLYAYYKFIKIRKGNESKVTMLSMNKTPSFSLSLISLAELSARGLYRRGLPR